MEFGRTHSMVWRWPEGCPFTQEPGSQTPSPMPESKAYLNGCGLAWGAHTNDVFSGRCSLREPPNSIDLETHAHRILDRCHCACWGIPILPTHQVSQDYVTNWNLGDALGQVFFVVALSNISKRAPENRFLALTPFSHHPKENHEGGRL